MNIRDAKVIGFFSLPSIELAEVNPTAYNLAMAGAPAGAGTCAHCGTGIRHHVVIEIDGRRAFLGTSCAEKVGDEHINRCIRERLTSEQIAAKEAAAAAKHAARVAEIDAQKAAIRARAETLRDIIEPLLKGNHFLRSLAEQLAHGPLSPRQAHYVAKALVGPRQTKANSEAWYKIEDRCTLSV